MKVEGKKPYEKQRMEMVEWGGRGVMLGRCTGGKVDG